MAVAPASFFPLLLAWQVLWSYRCSHFQSAGLREQPLVSLFGKRFYKMQQPVQVMLNVWDGLG
ncbi:MAG: hypothetical protein OXC07_10690 [Kistimonas sp.]|nr:hypothetical protein [Kistimonas sp.]